MSDYTEIVARVRDGLTGNGTNLFTGDRVWVLTQYVSTADLRALCDTVERLERELGEANAERLRLLMERVKLVEDKDRLERERDAERQAREQTFAWYDERRAELTRLTAEVERLRGADVFARLYAKVWAYGDWKAETYNERELERILTTLGYWPTTTGEIEADAARRALGGTDA